MADGFKARVGGGLPARAWLWGRGTQLLGILRSVIIPTVISSFADDGTADVFHGVDSRRARASCPVEVWPVARRKLDQLNRVRTLTDLRIPPGNRLERLRLKRLRHDRAGQHSILINAQYRACFRWEDGHAYDVEITDYH